ncbi:MAG: rluB [Nitrospira sp.]|nr:rluB [Nitrospira sp.]
MRRARAFETNRATDERGEMEIRLQKLIAGTGLASRRKAEGLIAAGRVMVNGKIVTELGTRVNPERDHVKVDGKHLSAAQPFVYLMLNKPKNVVSTLDDPGGRTTVKDYLRGVSVRVFPVGRLDFDSEGLMLLTNNGDLAQALLHPRYHVPKTYLIKVKGVLTDEDFAQLEQGVRLEDGMTSPAQVKKVRKVEANSWLEMTIREGRKHQVKRMLESVGHPVIKLMRIRMGPLSLGHLAPGEFRFLTDREANTLRELVDERVALAQGVAEPARPSKRRPRRSGWARSTKIKKSRGRAPSSVNR